MADKPITLHGIAWEQQPGETAKAYAAFQVFLKMGADRTSNGAYRQVKGNPEAKEPPSSWRDWQRFNRWFERAEAYDRHLASLEREAEEKAFKSERKKWAGRRSEVRSTSWDIGQQLIDKAKQILVLPLTERETVREEIGPDGRTIIQHIVIKPVKATLSDAKQMLELGDKLLRLSTDMETERITHDSVDAQRARQLQAAREAFAESGREFPEEDPQARAEAIAAAFGFPIEQILAEPALASEASN